MVEYQTKVALGLQEFGMWCHTVYKIDTSVLEDFAVCLQSSKPTPQFMCHEDGGSRFIWNIWTYLTDYNIAMSLQK
jgi:hypothetical protein